MVHRGQIVAVWRWDGRRPTRAPAVEPFIELPADVADAVPALAAALP